AVAAAARRAPGARRSPGRTRPGVVCSGAVAIDLVVAAPTFLDMAFVGLGASPAPGEERFAGGLVRSPGGGGITAVAAARLGLSVGLAAPLGDDDSGRFLVDALAREGV